MGRDTVIKMTCGNEEHIIRSLWHAIFHPYHSMVSVWKATKFKIWSTLHFLPHRDDTVHWWSCNLAWKSITHVHCCMPDSSAVGNCVWKDSSSVGNCVWKGSVHQWVTAYGRTVHQWVTAYGRDLKSKFGKIFSFWRWTGNTLYQGQIWHWTAERCH